MKMKRIIALSLVTLLVAGCGADQNIIITETKKPVSTAQAEIANMAMTETYLGTVVPEGVKSYAFKSPGRIGTLLVDIGDQVEVGDVLATLDTTDLSFQLESAKLQLASAKAQYDQVLAGAASEDIAILEMSQDLADQAYQLAQDQADDMTVLYEEGVISEVEYQQVMLNALNAQTSLGQVTQQLSQAKRGADEQSIEMALYQFELAQIQLNAMESLLEDATITASEAGVVIDVPYEEETLIDAGMPVTITRSTKNHIQLGISQKDLQEISKGDKVDVIWQNSTYSGEVDFIDQFADQTTGTFLVEVAPTGDGAFPVPFGGICEVVFQRLDQEGIWIPLTAVLSEGIDYVYLDVDGYAIKRRIDIEGMKDSMVLVSGIEEGEWVLVEGTLAVEEGDAINASGGTMNE